MLSLTTGLFRRADVAMSPRQRLPDSKKKKLYSVRLDRDVEQAIKKLVAENRSNFNMEVNRILALWLKQENLLKKS